MLTKSIVISGPQKGNETTVYFSDFRKVDGLTFPFLMDYTSGGQTVQKIFFSDIEINKEIDDAIFNFPDK